VPPPTCDQALLESVGPSALVPRPEKNALFARRFAISPPLLSGAINDRDDIELEDSSLEHISRTQDPFLSAQESPLYSSSTPLWNDFPFLADFSTPPNEINSAWSFDPGASPLFGPSPVALFGPSAEDNLFNLQDRAGESPFSQLRTAVAVNPRQGIYSQHKSREYTGAGPEWDLRLGIEPRQSAKILVQSLLDDAAQVLIENLRSHEVLQLPHPDYVLDSLLSLLHESPSQDESVMAVALATGDAIFDCPFYSALLFSISNGFAGLRTIPSGAVLKMLRKQQQISSRPFYCLRLCPPGLTKTLAENLFGAAVEACDEQAVIVILQTSRNSPNAIDPNEIVCEVGDQGRLYNPIEIAAKSRHLGIVQTLLAANADVNKTYEQDETQERGALELAVRKWAKYEAVDMKLVRTLLDCHTEVRVDLVNAAIRWGQTDLILELISRLPLANYSSCFKMDTTLTNVPRLLKNSLATRIIKQLFEYCQAANCLRCLADHQEEMDSAIALKKTGKPQSC
jgi:hypothetical protein